MKKSPVSATSAKNLEEKFDRGGEVLAYFDAQKAKMIVPARRAAKRALPKAESAKAETVREDAEVFGGGTKRARYKKAKAERERNSRS